MAVHGSSSCTRDGYYESVVLDPDGNHIEITAQGDAMRLDRIAGLLLIALSLVLGACARERDSPKVPEVVLTAADAGAVVSVATGARIVLRLESNPSTGYRWSETAPPRESVRRLGEDSFEAPDTGRIGAPGVQVFTYEVTAPGRARVALAYARSWEQAETAPARSFEFTVVAR
jgi:inhibitor of cysteine peptidase